MQRVGKNLHKITDEIARWKEILAVPYREDQLATQAEGSTPLSFQACHNLRHSNH